MVREENRLVVAICTNRAPELVAPTLREVAAQVREVEGSAAILVASGADDPAASRLAVAAAEHGVDATREGRPGLAAARNRAVEGLGDGDVVAFVDDDALPDPGWLRALAARWEDAPPELAVIGGAIDPLWTEPPPAWMSERLDIVFSLLDRGPGVVALKPGIEDAWGVNVSFRAGPLRSVGGFDPMLGPVGGIPYFADETEVQRRLASAGYRGIYAGDVRVRHVVSGARATLRQVFRRRFYAGASMRNTGQWTMGGGFARLGAGLAAAPVAVVRRRPEDLGLAVARAGSGLGVVAAPLVAARIRRKVGGG